jgi:DNA-binding NarL/FixJ family response regulator
VEVDAVKVLVVDDEVRLAQSVARGLRADAFDPGADDYLPKPFSFVVLIARLRSLVRRAASARPSVLRAGDLVLDPARHRVTRAGTELTVSRTARPTSETSTALARRSATRTTSTAAAVARTRTPTRDRRGRAADCRCLRRGGTGAVTGAA